MKNRLSTKPYRGTRDFLPDEMSVRLQVFARLYQVIESYGFGRYDGPLLEPLDIYAAKSGEEIVSRQLYRFEDRGGREVALRPEMTPTVSRIIAANAGSLAFPVRWYSHPNCFRYERPQRGRLREHWQINVDIFGPDSPQTELEIFELIFAMLRGLGASDEAFKVRVSDRRLIEAVLTRHAGVPEPLLREVYGIIDRWAKRPEADSLVALSELGLDDAQVGRVQEAIGMDFGAVAAVAGPEALAASNLARILAEEMTDLPLCFDPMIIRGFDYYTSTVFEVFDNAPENRRSLFGGGRYDSLVSLFGAKPIAAIGFGMGDVTLFDFLAAHDLLPEARTAPAVYVMTTGAELHGVARRLADSLRDQGLRTITALTEASLKSQLKEAARKGAEMALIVAEDEWSRGHVILRDLRIGEQQELAAEGAIEACRRAILMP
jgi:histidyl-tRNA synthetase